MSLCKNGKLAIKKFGDLIDDKLEAIINDVTVVTGKIKAFEASPTVQAIAAIIPGGSTYIGIFDKALDLLAGEVTGALTLAERIAAWLAGKTPLAIHGDLNKLAATSVRLADTETHPIKTELFYDTVVQNHFATINAAKSQTA